MKNKIKITYHYSFSYIGMDFLLNSVESVWEDFDNLNNFFEYLNEFEKYLNENYGQSHNNNSKVNCFSSIYFRSAPIVDDGNYTCQGRSSIDLTFYSIKETIKNKEMIEKIYNMLYEKEVKNYECC